MQWDFHGICLVISVFVEFGIIPKSVIYFSIPNSCISSLHSLSIIRFYSSGALRHFSTLAVELRTEEDVFFDSLANASSLGIVLKTIHLTNNFTIKASNGVLIPLTPFHGYSNAGKFQELHPYSTEVGKVTTPKKIFIVWYHTCLTVYYFIQSGYDIYLTCQPLSVTIHNRKTAGETITKI